MSPQRPQRVCLVPRMSGVGGMVSFQHKLAAGLAVQGVGVCYDLADKPYDSVLVIGGTRQLAALWRARKQSAPVIQRLDGMNWLHRVPGHGAGWRHFMRAEYGNLVLRLIRARLATQMVYQSEFARGWWERAHGPAPAPSRVIYNGIDLEEYTPDGPHERPEDRFRLLLVEGSLMGGYEQGLGVAVELARRLATVHRHSLQKPLELMVVGRVPAELRREWETRLAGDEPQKNLSITWRGLVERGQIPEIDRSAHLLYSADINPACPNAVIEALACGLPVVSFDTGALPELVQGDAGRVVPYGGDPWRLDPPDVEALAKAAVETLEGTGRFRRAARARAQTAFSLDHMTSAYLDVMQGL